MPKQINHEFRRQQIAEVAARLIAQDGLEALTIRGVAAAAGSSLSTSVVSHYFRSKRELLLHTYRFIGARARATPRPAGGWTVAALRKDIESRLPLTRKGRESFGVWFAFWAIAAADPEFARQQAHEMRLSRAEMRQRIQEAYGIGSEESGKIARRALTLTWGLAVEICFDDEEDRLSDDRDAVILELLNEILPPPPAPDTANSP